MHGLSPPVWHFRLSNSMCFILLSASLHATHLAMPLKSRTCLTIVEFSEYFDKVSLYTSQAN